MSSNVGYTGIRGDGRPSPEYVVWGGIWARCNNPNHPRYSDYGGRGITVCKDWKSFEKFYEDMCPRPKGLSIERRDNNKGYSKANCYWTTTKTQAQNRRSNVYVELNGERLCFEEACRRLNQKASTIRNKITRRKMTHQEAIDSYVQ